VIPSSLRLLNDQLLFDHAIDDRAPLGTPDKNGSMRFGLLVLVLIATAVGVTVAMFETLYYVMG